MKTLKTVFSVMGLLALISGCAKDRDLDGYKSYLLARDLARLQKADGIYSGILLSKADGSKLGAMTITLQARTEALTSTDQTKASGQPIETANVEFQGYGSQEMSMAAQNAFYDPGSGQFNATITLARTTLGTIGQTTTTTSYQVQVDASVKNGVMSGTVESVNYPDDGGKFTLATTNPMMAELVAEGRNTFKKDLIFQNGNYIGTTQFNDRSNTAKPVNLVVLKPDATGEEEFLTLLLPIKPVIATLNYGNGARITFLNATWDTRTNPSKLSGTAVVGAAPGSAQTGGSSSSSTGTTANPGTTDSSGAGISLSMSCDFNSNAKAFNCTQSVAGSPVSAITTVKQAQPGAATEPQRDNEVTRDTVTKTFNGTADFEPGVTSKIALTFVWDARTRMQEITQLFVPQSEQLVQVSIVKFAMSHLTHKEYAQTSVAFTTTKWDNINNTLDGTQQYTSASTSVPLYLNLHCDNFKYENTDPNYKFNCTYSSTMLPASVTLKLNNAR